MLKRVSIQNFKSLKDVTLDLQKVNLLIGPNNSGKTNFLKALEYLKVNYRAFPQRQDVALTFNRMGNSTQIFLTDDNEDPVHIDVTYNFYSEESSYKVYNSRVEFSGNGVVPNIQGQRELEQLFLGAQIYKPDPNKLIQPGPVGILAETVNVDASNLIGFLDRMLGNKYRKSVFDRIQADLRTCVPEFDEVSLDDASPTKELKELFPSNSFKRLGLTNGNLGITYWADELSEGTLYFIALLCIVNQPNPPKLLILEEPEKGIHPRRIQEIMNFIRRLVAEKDIQVIMTTHSPMLLDEFAESPESVFVFDKDDDGATFVKNLQQDIIEPANQKNAELGIPPVHYTDALGEYWTIGFLGGVPHETA
ncbi:AAA family ATPase [Spirosoma flavum]|uniref:AAA family ATPase n=1 Tax=Spirosoma flavum TaxID=2048557 RepID=A0ABW6AV79_9BACT